MRSGSHAPNGRRSKGKGRAPIPSVSNLQAFFAATSPFIPVRPADPLTSPPTSDLHFNLRDLWSSFEECSAYGAAVPITLPGKASEKVTAYYAPSLSAIQIFAPEAKTLRRTACDGDADCCSGVDGETLEDSSDDSSVSSMSSAGDVDHDGCEGTSPRRDNKNRGLQRSNSVLCKQKIVGEPGRLLFQYCEEESPYNRLPLTDKVEELALQEGGFTGLLSLRSCDIHPASWFAVAWYPIYHLPAGHSIRELGASFLTYHSLTLGPEHPGVTPSQELLCARPSCPMPEGPAPSILQERYMQIREVVSRQDDYVPLHPFAYASYRMQGRLWHELNQGTSSSMLAAAGVWVKRRQFMHSDLDFFMRTAVSNHRSTSGSARRNSEL